MTLVSFGIPTFNRARFLPATVESLLGQDHDDIEIIISDNASTDETGRICRQLVERDSRIRYYRNETNIGLAANFNRVIELCGAPYLVIAGDDDLYDRRFASTLAERLDGDSNLALAACAADEIDERGEFVRSLNQRYFEAPAASLLANANRMLWHGYGNLMTGMFRRETLLRTRRFEYVHATWWDAMDLILLFDVSLAGDVVWTPEVLLHKRRGGISAEPLYRSFGSTLGTIAGMGRGYLRRVQDVAFPIRQRLLLAASVLARTAVHAWAMKGQIAKSFLLGWASPATRARIGALIRGMRSRTNQKGDAA